MNLTTRARRRIIAATALGCAALLLPAAVALASSAAPSRSAVPRCGRQSTEVWLGLNPDGAALGTTYYPLEFTNVSHHDCTLFGYPGVSAINHAGREVGNPAEHGGRRHTITLKPGQTAHAMLGIVEDGVVSGCHSTTAAGLEVYPPNETTRQPIYSFSFPACKSRAKHVIFMNVGPVQANVGIP